MQKIIQYVRRFINDEFHPLYFGAVALFLLLSITLNYSLELPRLISGIARNRPERYFILYLIYYALPFYFCTILHAKLHDQWSLLRSKNFWILSGTALFSLAFDHTTDALIPIVISLFPPPLAYWIAMLYLNLAQAIVLFVPAAIYWYRIDRNALPLYGFTVVGFDLKPYFLILAFMAPLLFAVSFTEDFVNSYPRYHHPTAAEYLALPPIATYLPFELIYGTAFVSTEFLFRGFLTIGFGRITGSGAILPMVALYCFIHFEKPLLEAISSIAGGMALGIIAYYGRSIYGGIIAHLGVAWMMELFAFFQIGMRE